MKEVQPHVWGPFGVGERIVKNPGTPITRPAPKPRRVTHGGRVYACYPASALLAFLFEEGHMQ